MPVGKGKSSEFRANIAGYCVFSQFAEMPICTGDLARKELKNLEEIPE